MDINVQTPQEIHFSELIIGDVFYYGQNCYMRTNGVEVKVIGGKGEILINAINLRTGFHEHFHGCEEVIKVQAELQVKKGF